MNYTGVIIEESLNDTHVLDEFKIVSTKVEPVTPQHKTPWLKQWTLHTIEVAEPDAAALAKKLSHALELSDREGGNWYIDYKNDAYHYIIFPGKVFKVERSKPDQYQAVVEFGLSLGIPDYQLDFSPAVREWQRPG